MSQLGLSRPRRTQDYITDVYKYKESDITILCDDDPENLPVRKRIVSSASYFGELVLTIHKIQALHDLVKDARPGDEFWFHCQYFALFNHQTLFEMLLPVSGHGSQVKNLNGTEKDGLDEGDS